MQTVPKIHRPGGPVVATEVEEETKKVNVGYIVEHSHVAGKLNFSKVLTENPNKKTKKDDKWITILLYRPTVEYPLGAVISFDFGEHNGQATAVNTDLITTSSPLAEMFEYISNPDIVEDSSIEEVHPSSLARNFMMHTHSGLGKDSIKAFLIHQNIYTIIGWVGQKRIIVRKLEK